MKRAVALIATMVLSPAALCQVPKDVIVRGNPSRPEICLTFDDGPDRAATPLILAALAEAQVPATFFVIGRQVRTYPTLVRAMLEGGHEIGNHTGDHVYLDRLGMLNILDQLRLCEQEIAWVTGKYVRLMRPPGMHVNEDVFVAAMTLGYVIVGYTVGAKDFALEEAAKKKHSALAEHSPATASEVYERVVKQVRNGSIILLHENVATAEALPRLLRNLKLLGFRFVSVSELMARLPQPVYVAANPVRDAQVTSPNARPRRTDCLRPRLPG